MKLVKSRKIQRAVDHLEEFCSVRYDAAIYCDLAINTLEFEIRDLRRILNFIKKNSKEKIIHYVSLEDVTLLYVGSEDTWVKKIRKVAEKADKEIPEIYLD